MEVQVALSRNMYGHSSVQSFELNPDDVQVRSSPFPSALLSVRVTPFQLL
jgi:hypothetical protein